MSIRICFSRLWFFCPIDFTDKYLKIHLMKMSTRISPSPTQITYHVLCRQSKYCRISKIPPCVKNIFECSLTQSTFCFLWICTNPWPGMSLSNISNTLDSQCDGDRAILHQKLRGSPRVVGGECWTCNPRVSGSIPGGGNLKKLSNWMKIHGLP